MVDYKSNICTNTEQPTRAGSAITHIWWNWIFQSWVTQIDAAAAAAVVHPPSSSLTGRIPAATRSDGADLLLI